MKIKLIKDIMVDEKAYLANTIVDVDDEFANELVEGKKAELYVEKKNIKIVEPEVKEVKEVKEAKGLEIADGARIEVKAEKLSAEQRLKNKLKIAHARATKSWNAETIMLEQKAAAGQNETTAADGGDLIDTDIAQGIEQITMASSVIYPKVKKRVVGRNFDTLQVKQLNETNATPADWQGISLVVTAEGVQMSPQKRSYTKANASVNKLTAYIPYTNELLQDDAHGILRSTEEDVGKAYGIKFDNEILYGTDSLFTAAVGHASAVAVTLADASSPTAAELAEMYTCSVNPAGSEWYMNAKVYENLITLEATNSGPVLVPNYALSPFGSILGRPVNVVPAMLGANGDSGTIGFCDWSNGYVCGLKGGVKMDSSIHVYFDTDETVFRFACRIAGMPTRAVYLTGEDKNYGELIFGLDT